MNPEIPNVDAQGMIYGEIEDFANNMMIPDYTQNRAKPENMPGDDPSEPGVTFSDDDMGVLEGVYGESQENQGCANDSTNY